MSKHPKQRSMKEDMEKIRKSPSIMRSPLNENFSENQCPFERLAISDATIILNEKKGREKCACCGRSRMWFCYQCRRPVDSLRGLFPDVKLPFAVDIIKHRKELDSKSTGLHAAILSKDVTIYTYPDIPSYDPEKVLLIFPHNFSFETVCSDSLEEGTFEKCKLCDDTHRKFPFAKIILIDSTWAQTKRIILDERISVLPHRAGLNGRKSVFWRPQRNKNPENLASIEALHQTCLMWLNAQGCQQRGEVDNLLFFFKYMHKKITLRYRKQSIDLPEE